MKASEDETRHGKPVAKLVPIDDEPPPARGSIAFHGEPVQQKLPNQSTACVMSNTFPLVGGAS